MYRSAHPPASGVSDGFVCVPAGDVTTAFAISVTVAPPGNFTAVFAGSITCPGPANSTHVLPATPPGPGSVPAVATLSVTGACVPPCVAGKQVPKNRLLQMIAPAGSVTVVPGGTTSTGPPVICPFQERMCTLPA